MRPAVITSSLRRIWLLTTSTARRLGDYAIKLELIRTGIDAAGRRVRGDGETVRSARCDYSHVELLARVTLVEDVEDGELGEG